MSRVIIYRMAGNRFNRIPSHVNPKFKLKPYSNTNHSLHSHISETIKLGIDWIDKWMAASSPINPWSAFCKGAGSLHLLFLVLQVHYSTYIYKFAVTLYQQDS